MENLAPDIVRQRLIIEGYYAAPVDADVIVDYFARVCEALHLRPYASPTIVSPGEAGREENQGFDAFMPLVDSGISLYVWTARQFLSVILFTCKTFDDTTALRCTEDFFAMTRTVHASF